MFSLNRKRSVNSDANREPTSSKLSLTIYILVTLIGVSLATPILAYVMSNGTYYLQSDSVNFGGGLAANGDNNLEDTLGDVGTGYSSNTAYDLHAGYQQNGGERYLSLSVPEKIFLLPVIYGVSGGTASEYSAVHVLTNSPGGYTLMARASTSPALQSTSTSSFFANYTTATSTSPDYYWNIPMSQSAFGFTADGPDIVPFFRDNGSACNQATDAATPETCWAPLKTTNTNLSYTTFANDLAGGSDTVLEFMAESGPDNIQAAGVYQALVIITAFMN